MSEFKPLKKLDIKIKKTTVLIVDDDEVICETLKEYLTNVCNYAVDTALNGQQALEKVQSMHPSVVVLDIDMPVLNGVEVIERIKKIDSRIPVIILTAHPDFGGLKEAYDNGAGACEFLVKPVDLEHLKAIVGAVTSK